MDVTSGRDFFDEFPGKDELHYDRFLFLIDEIKDFGFDIGDERLGIIPSLSIYPVGFQISPQSRFFFL